GRAPRAKLWPRAPPPLELRKRSRLVNLRLRKLLSAPHGGGGPVDHTVAIGDHAQHVPGRSRAHRDLTRQGARSRSALVVLDLQILSRLRNCESRAGPLAGLRVGAAFIVAAEIGICTFSVVRSKQNRRRNQWSRQRYKRLHHWLPSNRDYCRY